MSLSSTCLIQAHWPAPQNIQAVTTTRFGGVGAPPFDSLNLAFHVGDQQQALQHNLARVQQYLGAHVQCAWIKQVHGTQVIDACDIQSGCSEADAVYSDQPNYACAVLTADCLPLLFCSRDGREIAATHAGWKGLAAGVVGETLKRFKARSADILVWLGPAIGPQAFEVGAEVKEAFVQHLTPLCPRALIEQAFISSDGASSAPKYRADLYQLARLELLAHGIDQIYGGGLCTYSDKRFFSYRREAVTGRMASLVVCHI